MKRYFAFLLAAVLTLSLAGCGDSDSTGASDSTYISVVQDGYLGEYDDITVKDLLSGHYSLLYDEEIWDGGTTDSKEEIVQVKFQDSDGDMEDVTIQFKMLNEQCFQVNAFIDPMETLEKSTDLFAVLNSIYLEQYTLHNGQIVGDFDAELAFIQWLGTISGSAVAYGAASDYSGNRGALCELAYESPLDVSVPDLLDAYGLLDLSYYAEGEFQENPLADPGGDGSSSESGFGGNPLEDSSGNESSLQGTPESSTVPAAPGSNKILETAYYALTIPANWEGRYEYEKYDNTLVFYERESYGYGYGGMLFSISLEEDEGFREMPSYSELGALVEQPDEGAISPTFVGYIVVSYPTDVQFSEESAEAYSSMSEEIETVLSSFTPAEGYALIS